MCLSIYETADGKIQLMKGQPIGTTNRADMVFQKKYIGRLWVCLRMLIGRIISLVRPILDEVIKTLETSYFNKWPAEESGVWYPKFRFQD